MGLYEQIEETEEVRLNRIRAIEATKKYLESYEEMENAIVREKMLKEIGFFQSSDGYWHYMLKDGDLIIRHSFTKDTFDGMTIKEAIERIMILTFTQGMEMMKFKIKNKIEEI